MIELGGTASIHAATSLPKHTIKTSYVIAMNGESPAYLVEFQLLGRWRPFCKVLARDKTLL